MGDTLPKKTLRAMDAAVEAIERRGALLTFPIDNRKDIASIWSEFYPKTKMRWEWDSGGDNRVADLWHLRTLLSTSQRVVYTKWFRGRATFFSREAFTCALKLLGSELGLSRAAREMLEILKQDSPLSTKQLKLAADLKGRDNEAEYTRALKELWERLLIVGFGEFEDGAFPSLGIGSTRLLFEDLWEKSRSLTPEDAQARLLKTLGEKSPWYLQLAKTLKKQQALLARPAAAPPSVAEFGSRSQQREARHR
jgi:hypothetical protein